MGRKVRAILAAALCVSLMQGCKSTNEPEVDAPFEGKWTLTQISAKGEFQMLIPCVKFDSIIQLDTSFTALEGDYMEFKPGNSFQFKITTPFDYSSYCSNYAGRESRLPYSRRGARALRKRSATFSGNWWINGRELILTRAFNVGKALDTIANSFEISGNRLTIRGPARLDREYRQQGFSVFGTVVLVYSAKKP